MDRHDRLRAHLDGSACTVCGADLDAARIRILAERDDLAFVELPCDGCGAMTLGMVTAEGDGSAELDPAPAATAGSAVAVGTALAAPFGLDDVEDMRRFLARYQGDLRGLVDPRAAESDRGSGGAR